MSDWKELIERCRQKQQEIRKEEAQATGQSQDRTKPEAQAQNTQNYTVGPQDQSIADLRMQDFIKYNQKLSQNKSQIPNLAVQTQIFPPTKKGRRPVFNWQKIATNRKDIEIWQRGEQLNQLDLTSWIIIIKFADENLIARFTRYEFLRMMRKYDSSRDYDWLRGLLSRLGFTQFNIYFYDESEKWVRYEGSLAPVNFENSDGKIAVQLSKPLYALFNFDGWSFLNIDQRLALGQNQWAQAFHAYLSIHICPKNGLWWKKNELWKQWGQNYKNYQEFLKDFRRRVLKPLYNLEFITKVQEKKFAIGVWWRK